MLIEIPIERCRAAVSIAALSLSLCSCGGGEDDSGTSSGTASGPRPSADLQSATITYLVAGTASRASLTYSTAHGGTAQQTVTLPWSINYPMKKGDFGLST
jgi:hypothetical protein